MKYRGQCHCGDVKCETDLSPMLVLQCNCNSCRKKTGSMSVVCLYAIEEIKFTGKTSQYTYKGGSGGNIFAEHCEVCHTRVYNTFDYMEGMASVPIGIFEYASEFSPKLEIWTSAKLDWLKDDGCIQNHVEDSGVKERLVALLEKLEDR